MQVVHSSMRGSCIGPRLLRLAIVIRERWRNTCLLYLRGLPHTVAAARTLSWRVVMRKNTFVALVAFAALSTLTALAALPAPVAPQAPASAPDKHHAMYAECAKVCADCMLTCEATAHHCAELATAGKKEHGKTMGIAADCAEFCALSAKLTARHSDLAPTACEACAKACDVCAAECAGYVGMPEMKACVESCKKCAASCREMAKMTGHGKH